MLATNQAWAVCYIRSGERERKCSAKFYFSHFWRNFDWNRGFADALFKWKGDRSEWDHRWFSSAHSGRFSLAPLFYFGPYHGRFSSQSHLPGEPCHQFTSKSFHHRSRRLTCWLWHFDGRRLHERSRHLRSCAPVASILDRNLDLHVLWNAFGNMVRLFIGANG